MRKFFTKIAFVLLMMSCFGSAVAQQVVYRLSDGSDQQLGQIVFNYTSAGGYKATMNGEHFTVEITGKNVTATLGKLVITMLIDGPYWHSHVGMWRNTPVTTSFGDKGIARMFYSGMTTRGRLYHEELWLNGQLFNRSETIIDYNNQIVWSVTNDQEGILQLTRM